MTNANDNGEHKVTSLRTLPQAIEPPHDLWAGIEARIAAERQAAGDAADLNAGAGAPDGAGAGSRTNTGAGLGRGRNTWARNSSRQRWLAAAATITALAVGVWIGRSVLPGGSVTSPTPGPATTAHQIPKTGDAAALQAAYMSDPKYRQQRAALVKSLEQKLNSLPPDARAKVISSLATIHKSMQDLEAALGKDPSNALLQELLVNTYQDEMRVLTTVHEAGDAGKGI
jgi:hypothetical protein